MVDRKHKIVVSSQRPWLSWGSIVIGLALLVLAGWGLYSHTRATAQSDFQRVRSERNQLRDNNHSLSERLRAALAENQQVTIQLAYIKRSSQIDGDACALVKDSLAGLQRQNSGLREQLAFYRGIASPKQSSEGLRVYDLKMIRSALGARQYDYALLLIQPMHHDHPVSGKAEVDINGLLDGKRQSYPLSGMVVTGDKNLLFSFKYFQEIDGSFRLPAGFQPVRVVVSLVPGDGMSKVEESYDWVKVEQSAGVNK